MIVIDLTPRFNSFLSNAFILGARGVPRGGETKQGKYA